MSNFYYRAVTKVPGSDLPHYFYVKDISTLIGGPDYMYVLSPKQEYDYELKTFFEESELEKLKWHICCAFNYPPFQQRYSEHKLEFVIEKYNPDFEAKMDLDFPKYVAPKKELSVDEMMEQCLKWYPNCEWKISNLLMKDAGNELVPYYFVLFGKKTYHGEDEHWDPAYIDKDGNCYFESSLASSTGELNQTTADFLNKECFECAYYEYEGTVESVVKFVYQGIESRRK